MRDYQIVKQCNGKYAVQRVITEDTKVSFRIIAENIETREEAAEFSAVPELLTACENVLGIFGKPELSDAWEEVQDAINKAKGIN